jgi:glucans biosynthesis protein
MHGGAKGSGAPNGNRNAIKGGFFTHEALQKRKAMREFVKASRELLKEVT